MKGIMGDFVKQAQKIQQNMEKAQQELAQTEVEGVAGGGMVKVLMNGRREVRRVHIDPSLINEEDNEMLEDLLAASMNDALRKVEEKSQELMGQMAGGLTLPPGMKLPF